MKPLYLIVIFTIYLCLLGFSQISSNKSTEEPELIKDITSNNEKRFDSLSAIQLDTSMSKDSDIKILLPEAYRDTDITKFYTMKSEPWCDLYKDKNYYFKKAKITIERGFDDCFGDSTTIVNTKNESLILIKGLSPIQGKLYSITLDKQYVWVGETQQFRFYDKNYVLRGDGITIKSGQAYIDDSNGKPERWDDVKDYKLYLTQEGDTKEQLLISIPEFEGTFVKILWIGDLDQDKVPDLLLDVSPHYEIKKVILFLSSKAEKDEIVKNVGFSQLGFDC